jgi:hypothetical protein
MEVYSCEAFLLVEKTTQLLQIRIGLRDAVDELMLALEISIFIFLD